MRVADALLLRAACRPKKQRIILFEFKEKMGYVGRCVQQQVRAVFFVFLANDVAAFMRDGYQIPSLIRHDNVQQIIT